MLIYVNKVPAEICPFVLDTGQYMTGVQADVTAHQDPVKRGDAAPCSHPHLPVPLSVSCSPTAPAMWLNLTF